jgi:hypothetical protein
MKILYLFLSGVFRHSINHNLPGKSAVTMASVQRPIGLREVTVSLCCHSPVAVVLYRPCARLRLPCLRMTPGPSKSTIIYSTFPDSIPRITYLADKDILRTLTMSCSRPPHHHTTTSQKVESIFGADKEIAISRPDDDPGPDPVLRNNTRTLCTGNPRGTTFCKVPKGCETDARYFYDCRLKIICSEILLYLFNVVSQNVPSSSLSAFASRS